MKNIKIFFYLIVLLSVISCKKETTTSTNTNNSTPSKDTTILYPGKKLEILKEDLPNSPMTYNQAQQEVFKLQSKGWRFPTDSELQFMYLDRNVIGGFREFYYWGNWSGITPPYCAMDFKTGKVQSGFSLPSSTNTPCYVRLVRNIK